MKKDGSNTLFLTDEVESKGKATESVFQTIGLDYATDLAKKVLVHQETTVSSVLYRLAEHTSEPQRALGLMLYYGLMTLEEEKGNE